MVGRGTAEVGKKRGCAGCLVLGLVGLAVVIGLFVLAAQHDENLVRPRDGEAPSAWAARVLPKGSEVLWAEEVDGVYFAVARGQGERAYMIYETTSRESGGGFELRQVPSGGGSFRCLNEEGEDLEPAEVGFFDREGLLGPVGDGWWIRVPAGTSRIEITARFGLGNDQVRTSTEIDW